MFIFRLKLIHFLFWISILLVGSSCVPSGLYKNTFIKYNGSFSYTIGELSYQWEKISVSENDLAFYNRSYSSIIQINSTCRADYEDVSLPILTDHILYGTTDRKIIVRKKQLLDKRESLYSEIYAKMDGVEVKIAAIVMKKNSCIYDFSYISRPWNFGRGIGDFHRIIHGFKVIKQ